MPINQLALDRLLAARFTSESVANFLDGLSNVLDMTGAVTSQIQLDYQHAEDTVEPGDLVPFITLGLRPATATEAVSREPEAEEVVPND